MAEVWSSQGNVFTEVDAGPKFIVELTENVLNAFYTAVGNNVSLVFQSSSVEVFYA